MIYALSVGFAVIMVAAQGLLTRTVMRAATGAARGAWLCAKFSLWVGFFIALALAGRPALLSGGPVASGGYLALAIRMMLRIRREE